jgi:LuxR family maltose regulon positive regulatory protein
MLESIAATVTGHWSEGGQQALEAMQLLGPASWADPWGRFGWNMVARDLALSESWDDQAAPLRDARSALGRDPERRLSYEGIRALGSALAGSPLEALRIAAGVSDYARVKSMTILRLEIATAEALAHRELGDRDRAREELRAVAEAQAGPVSPARALALLGLVQICLDEADLDGAGACLAVAETYIRTELPGPDAATWLARQAFLVALAAGDLASAARRNERVEDKFWHGIGLARLHLHRGEHADAAAQLSAVAPRCPGHEVTRDLLLARTMPRGPESVEVYGAAVQRAVALGLMQTVASEGAVILDLLERHPWLAPEPWVAKVRRAAPPSPRTAMARLTLPGEHLTERELGVLRMLPSRLTLREIADELGISVNTVKFHLRVIYRKLGVGSRAEASALARGLVSLGHDERR